MERTSKSFIESQFPISKLSKESYKERKANYSQTLTGLGKWWGRKPLILVRATLLGLLMPASDDPKKDREIFLKILTMDADGLWQRKTKAVPLKAIYPHLTPAERLKWFGADPDPAAPKIASGVSTEEKKELQQLVFNRLNYDEKLTYCDRPEQMDGPEENAWSEINTHLGTTAHNLTELFQQLGIKRFGHIPRVGDAFCGGGSIPFEAARLGCDAFGSDLNPVAVLLTWAGLNIIGGGPEVVKQVQAAQKAVYDAVDRQIIEWGIEHHEQGWRADAYLYCTETHCPECGYLVPLAPAWVIGEKTRTIARLEVDHPKQRFEIMIDSGVSAAAMETSKNAGTIQNSYLVCPNPHCGKSTPIGMIRGERNTANGRESGLRLWENDDLVPRRDDVFQERLYCIRWVAPVKDTAGSTETARFYRAPDENDWQREAKVLSLLRERFGLWQEKGYIPSRKIESGYNTDQLIRERGWTTWHHLFNPRALLVIGQFLKFVNEFNFSSKIFAALLLGIGKCNDWNSKLCRWDSSSANEKAAQTFYNQALNTLSTYVSRGFIGLSTPWFYNIVIEKIETNKLAISNDARLIDSINDIWITDPPYADAVNYHELSEFFLAWYEKHLTKLFPEWYTDSKRMLAIQGREENFRKSMVDSYRNLTRHTPEDGMQVVMFTHQDASVWADLALIMWAAGLQVTAAWTIATETDTSLKQGNYVQGTVLLVLRKQTSNETIFLDEIYPEVELEVQKQLAEMIRLEDNEDPNFGDADYQLAAYAAALRVLTKYKQIAEIEVEKELSRSRQARGQSLIEGLIQNAVKIACDYLIPRGFDPNMWKMLSAEERFYIKGLEVESHGEYRAGVYQELARGFGVREYLPLLATDKANQTRLKTPAEFATKQLRDTGFGSSLARQVLFAIHEAVRTEDPQAGRGWLRNELTDFWEKRKMMLHLLAWFSTLGISLTHWQEPAAAARILAGVLENETI
ncbi:DUF1156 domain-containing protein [candidate division KSB1 bacterium]|nr:DUF1156 domain-containing protein [candidate division KSB1 bacterium]